eukprot:146334-Chlamydomonas_euryale.AAC.8
MTFPSPCSKVSVNIEISGLPIVRRSPLTPVICYSNTMFTLPHTHSHFPSPQSSFSHPNCGLHATSAIAAALCSDHHVFLNVPIVRSGVPYNPQHPHLQPVQLDVGVGVAVAHQRPEALQAVVRALPQPLRRLRAQVERVQEGTCALVRRTRARQQQRVARVDPREHVRAPLGAAAERGPRVGVDVLGGGQEGGGDRPASVRAFHTAMW